jgi:ferric-dicitrate binding protein FerR (iron transport regulator)
MIAIVLGIAFATYKIVKTPGKQLEGSVQMAVAETEAHPANFTVITLPDGSTVKMNASTKIEYPEHFAADVRKVKLSGEAFFEVTRDTAHPFIIETKNASVEVLGTSFNVSAYPEAGLVEVNVKTGKVKLTQHTTGNTASKSAILPAGERGWLKISDGEMGQEKILSPNYSAWISKEMVFQRTPLAEAFAVLENTYHVKIRMENPEIGRMPYTANFANLKLDYIVEVIARTHNLKVVRNDREIIFASAAH